MVICSPLTLFAFLAVIRQAYDNFATEQTTEEILQLLGEFGEQWDNYTEPIDKGGNASIDTQGFEALHRAASPARAATQVIDDLRRKRRVAAATASPASRETKDAELETAPGSRLTRWGPCARGASFDLDFDDAPLNPTYPVASWPPPSTPCCPTGSPMGSGSAARSRGSAAPNGHA